MTVPDLVARLKAGLDTDEVLAREQLARHVAARARGMASTLWDEQDQGARCMLRTVAAYRRILDRYEDCLTRRGGTCPPDTDLDLVREYEDFVLPALASIYVEEEP